MPNILLLTENKLLEQDLCEQINFALSEDYKVYTEDNDKTIFDVAVLDGQSFLPSFREKHNKVPALILVPSDSEVQTENNLNTFYFKPVVLSVLLNKIQTANNVFENSVEGYLTFGDYELHPADKDILNIKTGNLTKLTEREVNIIQYLYKARDNVVSKTDLLQNVWEYSAEVTTHTIETHIYRLRKKVEQTEQDAPLIGAEDGGYKLNS